MKRRDFLKTAVPAATMPFLVNGLPVKAYGRSPYLDTLLNAGGDTDRALVLIWLDGGNDGLNTIIPLDQYDLYRGARSNIALPESSILSLSDETGIHPAMSGMHSMFNEEQLCVVQNVGHQQESMSHFQARDLWLTGSDNDVGFQTGWLARYLANEFPDFPVGFPNVDFKHPIAIQIGSGLSLLLEGPSATMGMTFSTQKELFTLAEGDPPEQYGDCVNDMLRYVIEQGELIRLFNDPLRDASQNGSNLSNKYPPMGLNPLADQLRTVARFIGAGFRTRAYVLKLSGFDTHSYQVDETDHTIGAHAELLGAVSDAIAAFQDDLVLMEQDHRVVGMVFSEFGRRISSNGGRGTDHGVAAPVLVFGSNVNPAIVGENPQLPENPGGNSNLDMHYDFRSVYASILKDWFGVSEWDIRSMLSRDFDILPIIRQSAVSVDEQKQAQPEIELLGNYPNPVSESTRIRFRSDGSQVKLSVYDLTGREVHTIVNRRLAAGEHSVEFNARALKPGTYYYRLESAKHREMKPMQVLR